MWSLMMGIRSQDLRLVIASSNAPCPGRIRRSVSAISLGEEEIFTV